MHYTYLDLFKTPEMRRVSLLCILLFMVISCVFDTTVRNIANLNFQFYLSFMIAAAMELPADLLCILGINWCGRRWSSALSLLLCGLTMAVCAFTKGGTPFSGLTCLECKVQSGETFRSPCSSSGGSSPPTP